MINFPTTTTSGNRPDGEYSFRFIGKVKYDQPRFVRAVLLFALLFSANQCLAQSLSLFTNSLPAEPAISDTRGRTLGVKFWSSQSGTISAIKFYRAAPSPRGYVALLFTAGGKLLGQVTMAQESGPVPGWQQAVFADLAQNTLVQNSLIHDNQLNGINAVAANGSAITNNDIYNNDASCVSPFGATANTGGIKVNSTDTITFSNNKIHDQAMGIWFDSWSNHVYVDSNEIYHTPGCAPGGAAIYFEIMLAGGTTTDNRISNNYIHDTSDQGFTMSSSGDTDIFGNAFSNTGGRPATVQSINSRRVARGSQMGYLPPRRISIGITTM
jgi:parallel beta-helix repeat protein